jgi:hypothetical protein
VGIDVPEGELLQIDNSELEFQRKRDGKAERKFDTNNEKRSKQFSYFDNLTSDPKGNVPREQGTISMLP